MPFPGQDARASQIIIELRIIALEFEAAQGRNESGQGTMIAQRGARLLGIEFAGRQPNRLHAESSGERQQNCSPQEHSPAARRCLAAWIHSAIGQNAKDKSHEENIGGDMKIEIKDGMRAVGRQGRKRAQIQGHGVAKQALRHGDPARPGFPRGDQAPAEM